MSNLKVSCTNEQRRNPLFFGFHFTRFITNQQFLFFCTPTLFHIKLKSCCPCCTKTSSINLPTTSHHSSSFCGKNKNLQNPNKNTPWNLGLSFSWMRINDLNQTGPTNKLDSFPMHPIQFMKNSWHQISMLYLAFPPNTQYFLVPELWTKKIMLSNLHASWSAFPPNTQILFGLRTPNYVLQARCKHTSMKNIANSTLWNHTHFHHQGIWLWSGVRLQKQSNINTQNK